MEPVPYTPPYSQPSQLEQEARTAPSTSSIRPYVPPQPQQPPIYVPLQQKPSRLTRLQKLEDKLMGIGAASIVLGAVNAFAKLYYDWRYSEPAKAAGPGSTAAGLVATGNFCCTLSYILLAIGISSFVVQYLLGKYIDKNYKKLQ